MIWPCFHAVAIEQGFKAMIENVLFPKDLAIGYISNNPNSKGSIMAFRNNNKAFNNYLVLTDSTYFSALTN